MHVKIRYVVQTQTVSQHHINQFVNAVMDTKEMQMMLLLVADQNQYLVHQAHNVHKTLTVMDKFANVSN